MLVLEYGDRKDESVAHNLSPHCKNDLFATNDWLDSPEEWLKLWKKSPSQLETSDFMLKASRASHDDAQP